MPSASRKYSATVRADSATRRRAPGGSVIWPYTSAARDLDGSCGSMTPLSWNSSQRSLPSRVRSPTPPNTDTPPCFMAMLLMSSMMMTVLPTPAPPNRPILPPCRYGSSRSMTLMPVSNIFSSVDCSSSDGGSRWIGQRSLVSTGRLGIVHRLTEHVEHAAERRRADGHRNRPARIGGRHPALQAVGRLHGDGAHAILAQMLLDLDDDVDRLVAGLPGDPEGVVDRRQHGALELHVEDGPDDLHDLADVGGFCRCCGGHGSRVFRMNGGAV